MSPGKQAPVCVLVWRYAVRIFYIRTYSASMSVSGGEERRTGVSPGDAAHHCSAQGRRGSLANIIGNVSKKDQEKSELVERAAIMWRERRGRRGKEAPLSVSMCVYVCVMDSSVGWASDNIVVNTEAPPGKTPSVNTPEDCAHKRPLAPSQ